MNIRLLLSLALSLNLVACWSGNSNWSITSQKIDGDFDALTPAEVDVQTSLQSLRVGDLDKALVHVEHALEKNADLISALNVAGLIYEQLGAVNIAEVHFNKAVRLDRRDPITRNNYGTFLCNLGRIYEAEGQFVIAADNPDYGSPAEAYTNAGLCARKVPDIDRAAYYFQAALQQDPKYSSALFQLAGLNYQAGEFLQARQDISRYIESDAPNEKGLWLAARIERELGNKIGVQFYAEQLQKHFPSSAEAKQAAELAQIAVANNTRRPLPAELQSLLDQEIAESPPTHNRNRASAQQSASGSQAVNIGALTQTPAATALLESLPGDRSNNRPQQSTPAPISREVPVVADSPVDEPVDELLDVPVQELASPVVPEIKLPTTESQIEKRIEETSLAATSSPISADAKASNLKGENWLFSQKSGQYGLVLYSSPDLAALHDYIKRNKLKGDAGYYQFTRAGESRYGLIYGSYASEKAALAAINTLPDGVRSADPSPKSMASLQLAAELYRQRFAKGSTQPDEPQPGVVADQPTPKTQTSAPVVSAPSQAQPQVAKTATGGLRREDWILAKDPNGFTIQLIADKSESTIVNYVNKHDLPDESAYFTFMRDGANWYSLIYGAYASEKEAQQAAKEISPKIGSVKPWIRPLGQIHSVIQDAQL